MTILKRFLNNRRTTGGADARSNTYYVQPFAGGAIVRTRAGVIALPGDVFLRGGKIEGASLQFGSDPGATQIELPTHEDAQACLDEIIALITASPVAHLTAAEIATQTGTSSKAPLGTPIDIPLSSPPFKQSTCDMLSRIASAQRSHKWRRRLLYVLLFVLSFAGFYVMGQRDQPAAAADEMDAKRTATEQALTRFADEQVTAMQARTAELEAKADALNARTGTAPMTDDPLANLDEDYVFKPNVTAPSAKIPALDCE